LCNVCKNTIWLYEEEAAKKEGRKVSKKDKCEKITRDNTIDDELTDEQGKATERNESRTFLPLSHRIQLEHELEQLERRQLQS
jgi:hypothetical protein